VNGAGNLNINATDVTIGDASTQLNVNLGGLNVEGGTTTLVTRPTPPAGSVNVGTLTSGSAATLATDGSMAVTATSQLYLTGQLNITSGNLTISGPAGGSLPVGLAGWYDASDINAGGTQPGNGAVITTWLDKSGNGRNLGGSGHYGSDPNLVAGALNGQDVVNFDGNDWIRTAYNFGNGYPDPDTYTLVTVARYTGGDSQRVIASGSGRNFLFGFHGNQINRWHADGWIYSAGVPGNTNWYIHAGTIGPGPNPPASFWSNGALLTANNYGSHDTNYGIGRLEFGAWNGGNETSRCEVAEVLVFDRVLSAAELNNIGGYLNTKYALGAAYSGSLTNYLGDVKMAGGTSLTLVGPGPYSANSIASTGSPVVSGGFALVPPPANPTVTVSPDGETMTFDATINAASFNVSGTGTVALKQNLSIAPGGSLTNRPGTTIATLNSLTVDAAQGAVKLEGRLDIASGTLTFKTPPPIALPPNAIGYWPMNEGSGTNTADLISGNDGVINANASWVNDPTRGWVLNFPSSGSVTIPPAALAALSGGSQVTISLWQYGDPAVQPRADFVFEGRNASNQRVIGSHLPWNNSRVYWDAGNTGGSWDRIDKAASASEFEGTWHNWTFVKDATAGILAIYLDGNPVPWHSGTGRTRTMETIASFRIGSGADGSNPYAGMIDEFAIWSRALTTAEIQTVYNAGLAGGYGPARLGDLTMATARPPSPPSPPPTASPSRAT